jgi:hypothetical protein
VGKEKSRIESGNYVGPFHGGSSGASSVRLSTVKSTPQEPHCEVPQCALSTPTGILQTLEEVVKRAFFGYGSLHEMRLLTSTDRSMSSLFMAIAVFHGNSTHPASAICESSSFPTAYSSHSIEPSAPYRAPHPHPPTVKSEWAFRVYTCLRLAGLGVALYVLKQLVDVHAALCMVLIGFLFILL